MDIRTIIRWKIWQATGHWPSLVVPPFSLAGLGEGLTISHWNVPGMPQPDLASFTEQDDIAARGAGAAWRQDS